MSNASIAMLLGVLLSSVWRPSAAWSEDTWADPFPGVRWLHRQTGDQNVNVLVVNLCYAGVSVRATDSSERGQTVPDFAVAVGAQAAVNANFFFDGFAPDGLVVHEAVPWPDGADDERNTPVSFGTYRAEIAHQNLTTAFEPWMREVVSGQTLLLWEGAVAAAPGAGYDYRTAVGLTRDQELILAAVDGPEAGWTGMDFDGLVALMQEMGAYVAVNMDGGGSTQMWVQGYGVVNDQAERYRAVASHLAVYARGIGLTPHCTTIYAAELVAAGGGFSGMSMTLVAGSIVSGWLELRNAGTVAWEPGRTNLGTTVPQDHACVFATGSWIGPSRPATIDRVVAPGETGRFEFEIASPASPGVYTEHFNLVEEDVAWFSNSGGPPDDTLRIEVTSVPPSEGSVEEAVEGESAQEETAPEGSEADGTPGDAGDMTDPGADLSDGAVGGTCGCRLLPSRDIAAGGWGACIVLLAVLLACRRKNRPAVR